VAGLLSVVDARFHILCVFQVLISMMAHFSLLKCQTLTYYVFLPLLNALLRPLQVRTQDLVGYLFLVREKRIFGGGRCRGMRLFSFFPKAAPMKVEVFLRGLLVILSSIYSSSMIFFLL